MKRPMRTGSQQTKAQVLPLPLIYGCHQCEGFAPHPVQYVSPKGKVFIFCEDNCMREWFVDRSHYPAPRKGWEVATEDNDYDDDAFGELDEEEEDSVSPDDLPVRSPQ